MPTPDEEIKHDLEILQALNRAIAEGPWEYNLFFQGIGKRLIEVRDRFKHELKLEDDDVQTEEASTSESIPARLVNRIAQRTGLIEVFVSLYNADGDNLNKWEGILSAIGTLGINRPTYSSEAAAKSAIRAAPNKHNEAYVAIYIRQSDVLAVDPHHEPVDRYGNKILNVKENTLRKENITYFMHASGRYEFDNNRLVRLGNADFL